MTVDSWSDHRRVAIAEANQQIAYPQTPPYRPASKFPEFSGRIPLGEESNPVYELCRQLFVQLGLDAENADGKSWNPLQCLVFPGNRVLVKPNLVRHIHLGGGNYESVVTHGSVIRCILDYVALALAGKGEIIVGDAPVQSADFQKIIERTGLQKICDDVSSVWDIPVRLVDFRLVAVTLDENHCIVDSQNLVGDSSGYRAVDLGQRSLLAPLADQHERFRVTSYDCREMVRHHNHTVNEYLIPKTVLDADVIINIPKFKTHRKVGLTAALKNIVGINGHKDWLPHHRSDSVVEGGDEYLNKSNIKKTMLSIENNLSASSNWQMTVSHLALKVLGKLSKIFDDSYVEGSWYGNDTLWRTVLDLNRVLVYANNEGIMVETPQRRCFTIVDGIIAGDGEGPMQPGARYCGLMVAGANPVAIDSVLATIAGFDMNKIPIILNGYKIENWQIVSFAPQDIIICSGSNRLGNLIVGEPFHAYDFIPPAGWVGHIEFTDRYRFKK